METPPQDTIVKIVDDVSISLPQPWKRSGVTFTNATELVRFASDDERRQIGRIIMYAEHRTDHKEAVRRLAEITAGPKNAGLEFFPASGWPAVERWYLAPLPVRGENEPTTLTGSDERALWLTLAIAYRDLVIRLEATFVPDPDPRIAKEVRDAGRAMKLPQRLDVKGSEQELLSLERGDFAPFVRLETTTERGVALLRPKGAAPQLSLAPNGFSEIELAASANGERVVIATNGGGLSFSTDSGATLSSGALTLGFPVNGDPSVAWGPSGTFYHAQIGFPDGTTAAGGVTGCSTVISASTTLSGAGGFSFRAHATFCPSTGGGMCFPDQEHIAADRTNAAPGGDQVYSVWRHFTPLFGAPSCPVITGVPRPSISCSAASGVSWTQPTFIGNGDIPRVTVGSDGFVYVVYTFFGSININKFSSCSAGLVPQRGFPVLIDAVAFGDCPAGLDRCGESVLVSPMVAVDDTNPARVFVAYAKSSSRTNDDILLKDSVDAGATWSGAALSVSAPSVSARRFMPWVCTTNGTAWVSWYDRRSATAGAPDLTEYFLGGAYRKGAAWVVEPQRNLSGGMPDPQCTPGFIPFGARDASAAEGCPVQPQIAGVCKDGFGGGSLTPCDFSTGTLTGACPFPEYCQQGNNIAGAPVGLPNWGDYNGNACSAGGIFTAWASATAPSGLAPLPPASGIRTFADVTKPSTLLYISITVNDNWPGVPAVGRFNVLLDGMAVATSVGTFGSGPLITSPGTHSVRVTAGAGTNLADYSRQIGGDCAPAGDVVVQAGRVQTCSVLLTNFDYLHTSGCEPHQKCCEPGTGMQSCQLCIGQVQSCP